MWIFITCYGELSAPVVKTMDQGSKGHQIDPLIAQQLYFCRSGSCFCLFEGSYLSFCFCDSLTLIVFKKPRIYTLKSQNVHQVSLETFVCRIAELAFVTHLKQVLVHTMVYFLFVVLRFPNRVPYVGSFLHMLGHLCLTAK